MKLQKTEKASIVSIIGGIGALIILGTVISFMVTRTIPMASGTSVATATTSTGIPPSPTSFLHERETSEAAVMETQLALIETITPSPPPTGRPPTVTQAPFITGIFAISYGPGLPQAYAMSSVWKEVVDNQRTLVFAGARRDTTGATPDITRGLVVVQVYSTDLSNKVTVEYEAPGTTGILQIIAAAGNRLTLIGQNGETLYFDVPARQFVDGQTATITAPTMTPLPPIEPTAIAPTQTPTPQGYPQPASFTLIPATQIQGTP